MSGARDVTRFEAALRRVAADLDDLGVRWALVGGLAQSAYGIVRRLPDVDVTVDAPDAAAIGALADALRGRGYTVHRASHDALGEIVVVHPFLPDGSPSGILIDLLPGAGGFEAELVAAARPREVLGGTVPVARIGHLIAFKVKAIGEVNRARDRKDLRALMALADEEELDLARKALRLSVERGVLRTEDPFEIVERLRIGLSLRPTGTAS
jgi:hypothetical protein